jgi:DNA-binding CsgD family transcriptional regulator
MYANGPRSNSLEVARCLRSKQTYFETVRGGPTWLAGRLTFDERCAIGAYRLQRPPQPGLDGADGYAKTLRQRLPAFAVDVSERQQRLAVVRELADRGLLAGKPYFTSVLLEKLLHNYQLNKQKSTNAVLTSREQSVVKLVAEGHPNKVTCAMLNLSIKTVETHRAAAMRKLGLSSTAELVRYAIRERIISP